MPGAPGAGGWQAVLKSTWESDLDRLTVLLDCLHSLHQRTVGWALGPGCCVRRTASLLAPRVCRSI